MKWEKKFQLNLQLQYLNPSILQKNFGVIVPEDAPAPTTARIDSTPPPSGSTMKPVGAEVPADEVTRAAKPAIVEELNEVAKASAVGGHDIDDTTKKVIGSHDIDDSVKGGAKIASDPPAAGAKVTTTAAGAGGAKPPTPSAKTASKLADSLDLAKKSVKGHTNARNLLIAGAASIVGAGAYMRNRKNNNIETEYEQY